MTNLSALELRPGDVLDAECDGEALPIGTIAETIPHMANYWVKTARGAWACFYRDDMTREAVKRAIRRRDFHASPMFGNEDKPIRIVSLPRPDNGRSLTTARFGR
ncbi:hypothetical protein PBI_DEWDROP_101 [Microbacterium phage Dewdrop]|nr:hypothetical protein PBI_LEAF_101 [Microbacterium phage Leaf]QGZ17469.1 hypothetical protein PBI_DEWDROP_101 [Microbacterium phage Dewdrop]